MIALCDRNVPTAYIAKLVRTVTESSFDSTMTELFVLQWEQQKMIMQQHMFDLMKHFQWAQELHDQHIQIFEQQHVYSLSQSAFSQSAVSWSAVSQSAASQSAWSAISQSVISDNVVFSSSSITEKNNEDNMIKKFFEWMIAKTQCQNKRDRLKFAMIKTLKQDWSISDLKTMRDSNSSLYNLAVRELQISDDIVHSFKRELEYYKQFCDQTKTAWAADALADLWNQDQDLEDDFLFE